MKAPSQPWTKWIAVAVVVTLVAASLCLAIVWMFVSVELAVGVAAAVITIGAAVMTAISAHQATRMQRTVEQLLAHNEIRMLLNVQSALIDVDLQYHWLSSGRMGKTTPPEPCEYAPKYLHEELSVLASALEAARPLKLPATQIVRAPGSNEKPNEGEWSGYGKLLKSAKHEIKKKIEEYEGLIGEQPTRPAARSDGTPSDEDS